MDRGAWWATVHKVAKRWTRLKSLCRQHTTALRWGGRWEAGSGWGTHVHPWLIHVNVWQKPPQYCKVITLRLKFKKKKKITLVECHLLKVKRKSISDM